VIKVFFERFHVLLGVEEVLALLVNKVVLRANGKQVFLDAQLLKLLQVQPCAGELLSISSSLSVLFDRTR